MYCLDTNILVDYLRGDEEIKEKLENLFNSGVRVSITILAVCELYKGIFLANKQEESLLILNRLIDSFILFNITKETAIVYGQLYAQLAKKGKLTQETDLIIASVAINNNQILITRNKKDFESIPDLKLEIW
ncbi:MAG TPA: type II toxin-antitoxin system VapC family toxin [Candidatus Nanoarchaeia archaeon]|nr:type II toxin-antitoxin system VapC family toxin [Candidatus Nanoarchaeia archaeon]